MGKGGSIEALRITERGRIPAARYTSSAFAHLERDRMWPRVWTLAAHASTLARPGDRLVLDQGPHAALLVCDDGGQVRAFANTCRHRGARLCDAGDPNPGNDSSHIVCPVHGWRWRLDGALAGVARPDGLMADIEEDLRLQALPCAVRHGFVWVAWGADAPELAAFLGTADAVLAGWPLAQWGQVSDTTIAIDANWKTSVDMHNEAYHLGHLHPEVAPFIAPGSVAFDALGQHHRIRLTIDVPEHGRRAIEQVTIFPNVSITCHPDHAMVVRHRPIGSATDRVHFDEWSLAPTPSDRPVQRRVFTAEQALAPDAELGDMARADLLATMRLGRGVNNAAGASGRQLLLHDEESPIAHFHEVLDDYLYGT